MSRKTGWSNESRHARGYGTAWNKLRLQILRRDNGLCQCSQCQGGKLRVTAASEVHHKVSKADAERKGWTQAQIDDPANLASMHPDCHKREDAANMGRKMKPTIGLDGYPVLP